MIDSSPLTVQHSSIANSYRALWAGGVRIRQTWLYLLENDVGLAALVLDHHQQSCPNLWDSTQQTRTCVALSEAIVNAISHGNLELESELREADETAFRALRDLRRGQSPYRDRQVHVQITLTDAAAIYEVRDEGPGFNPAVLPDPTSPERLERLSGRGLLLIRTFMDEVSHNRRGNLIRMVKRFSTANGGHEGEDAARIRPVQSFPAA